MAMLWKKVSREVFQKHIQASDTFEDKYKKNIMIRIIIRKNQSIAYIINNDTYWIKTVI